MTAKLAETQLWQQNMASLIRSGLFYEGHYGRDAWSIYRSRGIQRRYAFGTSGEIL